MSRAVCDGAVSDSAVGAEHSIRFEDVSVEFAGRTALRDISIELSHRRIAVIGSNGSGKSTFARLLNGLVLPTSGTVRVLGLDPVREAKELRSRVGFMFSNPDAQIVMPTVAEDVAFSLRGRKLTRADIAERVATTLQKHGLAAHADAPAHGLSSGQKQLLALSAITITEPELLVVDEPTALLDAANTRRVADHLLEDIPQQLVLVTHDMRLAGRCDVAVRFEDGGILECGDPRRVIERYESDYG
jgi:biotin transport system ATP-binding protein